MDIIEEKDGIKVKIPENCGNEVYLQNSSLLIPTS
jgi:hypothetical protein